MAQPPESTGFQAVFAWHGPPEESFEFPVSVFPMFRRFHKCGIAVSADKRQCLAVFGILVAGVAEKALQGLAAFSPLTVRTGDMPPGQAADLHAASGPVQIPRAIQIPQLASLAGFEKFAACPAVRAAAADFSGIAHGPGPPFDDGRPAAGERKATALLFQRNNAGTVSLIVPRARCRKKKESVKPDDFTDFCVFTYKMIQVTI